MSTPPSQTRICNSALAHLGETARITTIDDNTPIAKLFKQVWDEAFDFVLADHPWNFAIHRQDLAVSADYTPAGSQWEFAYDLPGDCVRWLPYAEDHPDHVAGEQEGGYLLTNAEAPVAARYIRRVADPSKWSAGFIASLAVKLAEYLAEPITAKSAKMDKMAALYDDTLRKAKRQDGAATGDRGRRSPSRSTWLASRRRGTVVR